MTQLRKVLNSVLSVLAGVSFIVMVALVCWQVFTRYILQNPSTWSEELVGYMFAWMALFGASLVTGERGHMNIPVLVERFSMGGRKVFAILAEVVALLFSASILVYGGLQIASLAMGQMTSSLGVAIGTFYWVMPVCGILNVVYTVLNIVDICNGNICLKTADELEKEA